MNSSFDKTIGTDEWLTPEYIIKTIGPFDLDPCSPINRPWNTAKKHYNKNDDGLSKDWKEQLIFMNPPYGRETFKWMKKLSEHNNGIALIFARTETIGFQEQVLHKANAILFIKGRIKFYTVEGIEGGPAGAPSCLIAYGQEATKRLENCNIKGKIVYLNNN